MKQLLDKDTNDRYIQKIKKQLLVNLKKKKKTITVMIKRLKLLLTLKNLWINKSNGIKHFKLQRN